MNRVHATLLLAALLYPLVLVAAPAAPAAAPSPSAPSAEEVRLVYSIQAVNREASIRELMRWATERHGFLFSLQGDTISLRLPSKMSLDDIEKKVLGQGDLIGRSIQREDRGGRLAELAVQIAVKEKHLRDLQKLTADAGLSQTLALEKELARVGAELDALKGERNFIVERARTLQLQVSFSVSAQRPPGEQTSFGWASEQGVSELLGGFGE